MIKNILIKEYKEPKKVTGASGIYKELQDIKDSEKEVFVVFILNTQNQIMFREIVTIGLIDQSLIHPRETFKEAIRNNAKSIILAHNHPSGILTPSDADKDITQELQKAGKLLGIPILDHIIISTKGYYSFHSQDLM